MTAVLVLSVASAMVPVDSFPRGATVIARTLGHADQSCTIPCAVKAYVGVSSLLTAALPGYEAIGHSGCRVRPVTWTFAPTPTGVAQR